ncbi:response regulator [uncultured Ruminococcus sp.]|uniref:response regulator n=1 Tax=uncultured Ruminococcus sp. TaxID=165186 RepID=UPI0029305E6A|nr:response regulator [uncultured Ruminococcus sp.]
MGKQVKRNRTVTIAVIGSVILAVILVLGTVWMGYNAKKDTEEAVRSVSLLYLDELAGRREQVVEKNLQEKIQTIRVAIELMTEEDLSDKAHLETYQSRMKKLYHLDKFAFVDTEGLIFTSTGIDNNIDEYDFDYKTLSKPDISILNPESKQKSVIIAVPINITFQGKRLSVCFMSINMTEMLSGISMTTNTGDATFCNLYTINGAALTDSVLGGLAMEDNLLEAMRTAVFEKPYSYDAFVQGFQSGNQGVVSFTYNDISETLTYIPVKGTDWQLTYLIRESVISERISSISEGTVRRSVIQSVLTVAAMLLMFGFIIYQIKRNSRLMLQHETKEAESRVKQKELEQRLELQEQILEKDRRQEQQSKMIAALASDYWSVYYLELDKDEGVCYQSHADLGESGLRVGERFKYLSAVTAYANRYITEQYLDEFLRFVQPESIINGLKKRNVISYTYMVKRQGKESYETARFAGVRNKSDKEGQVSYSVGACFVDSDAETRRAMEQQQALNDALSAAEEASKAKTAFLSNMSHEIRTPMNAIIGLDSIALNDPDISERTREYLEKIGSSAEHLLGLINDILDMSRIESGRLTLKNEEFSFRKLLDAVNTMFHSQCQDKGLTYRFNITPDINEYYIGDNMKLRQILINILGNAVKFTDEGGEVQLQIERKAQFEGKSTLCFKISDTGIGISEDYLPYIYDAFSQEEDSSTNKYGSSGLGMAITKRLVEMMNGNILVESEKGVGTTFTVTITLSDSDRTEEGALADSIHPEDMTVLIVDDDPIARDHAQLILEKAGVITETAENGLQALEMVKLRHARREPYNLILVDWKMPEIDGLETTRMIRDAIGHESAIIILTAYRWDDILDEAVQAGVDGFLLKPLFAAAIMDEFKTAAKKKKLSEQNGQTKTDLRGRRVLLAEDMAINAEIMKMVLEMREIKADHAVNGRIAVELFTSHPEGYYDAILMDIRMPEMDGLEATRAIRASDRADAKTVPIIALTANAFDEDVQRSMQAGLNAHLSKPVQPEVLFETLESLIK